MQPDFVYTLTTPAGAQQRIPITLVEQHGTIAIPDTFTTSAATAHWTHASTAIAPSPATWPICYPIAPWGIHFSR